MSAHPLIHTARSRSGYLFDFTLTIVGWLVFLLLFASGLFNLLISTGMNGAREVWISPLLASSSTTLMIYAALAALNAVVLIGWAVYNYRRFSGKSRRKPTLPLPRPHLQASFALAPALLERTQDARVMVISHEEDSAICAIKIISKASSIPPPARTVQATPRSCFPEKTASPLVDKRSTVQSRRDDVAHHWQWQKPLPAASTP